MSAVTSGPSVRRKVPADSVLIIGGAVILIAAIVIATALAVATSGQRAASAPGMRLVAAAAEISARTVIRETDLQLLTVSPAPAGAFTRISDLVGKVARVDIHAGSAIQDTLVADTGSQVSSAPAAFLDIPQGLIAVAIPTSEEQGVGGFVRSGDFISVLASVNGSAFPGGHPGLVVRTVFRHLHVLRAGSQDVGAAMPPGLLTPQLGTSMTVLLTPCDAEYVNWLLSNATLKYELESHLDYPRNPTVTDTACTQPGSTNGVSAAEADARWHFGR